MSSPSKIILGKSLKELRIILCQKSKSSQGVREFVQKYYVPLKKANPQFPILIRECSGVLPKLYARYDYGQEEGVVLTDESADSVLKHISELAARSA